jgi:hypothetical protein
MQTPSKLHADFYRWLTGKEPDEVAGIPTKVRVLISILGDVQVRRTLVKAALLERRVSPAKLAKEYDVSTRSVYFLKHSLRAASKPTDPV